MKIAVMGAGAVGCYYGGMLARAGHEVVFIGRPAHVEAMQRDGLLLDTQSFRERVPVQASTNAEGVRGAGLVLFCVKSTDTAAAAAEMAPHLAPDASVLSLQNGVDNADRLQAALLGRVDHAWRVHPPSVRAELVEASCRPVPALRQAQGERGWGRCAPGREVLPAVVYVATEMAAPGHVRHLGRGELVVGPGPRSEELVSLFGAAGVPVQVSDQVSGELWAKLLLNCAYNALSAITQQPYGRLVQGEGVEAVMRDVVNECLAVARAAGVSVPGDAWQAVQRIAQTMPQQFSSTAQDLARGKRSEIDHLNGFVVRQGEALGVDVRANRVLWATVKLLEAGRDA